MLIWPTSLLVQEGHSISAPAPGQEHDLAASAQAVDGEKHLVPRKIGALTHDLFEVARAYMKHHVDHLIIRGDFLRHVPPLGEHNALLKEQ
jgi:hypothetical protein